MPRSQKTNISSALLLGFLGCTAFVMPNTSAYAAQSVSAKSSWSVSRVASITQGNYCTMAQKYDNNAILSIARSVAGEYSLALDFQSPAFSESAQEAITLKAGKAKAEKFNVSPQSPQVAVINLGRDEDFLKALETSEKLAVSFSGKDLSFSTDRFKEGRAELMTCLSGLRGNAPIPVQPSSETASPLANANPQLVNVASNAPSIEGLLAARPKPSMGAEPISSLETSAPVIQVEAQPVEAPEKIQSAAKSVPQVQPINNAALDRQIQDLTIENAQLKRALSESRQSFENQISQAQGAAVSEVKEKLASAQNENAQLKSKVNELEMSLETMKSKSGESTSVASKSALEIESAKSEANRLSRQLEALKAENTTLKNQLDIATATSASSAKNDTSAFDQKIASLQKENSDLKTTIAQLEQQTARLSQMMESANGDDAAAKELQDRLAKLSSENTSLKAQVNELTVTAQQPKTISQMSSRAGDDTELHKEIRSLKIQIETLNGEKSALQTNFDKLQKEGEQAQIKTVGGSWDLEQATRRYQESQREIRRLGALLEDERLKCTAEKKEIEAMLFDPNIADSAQIAKLNALEDQLKAKETLITDLQAQLTQAASKPSEEQEQQIAILKKQIGDIEQRLNYAVSEKEAAQSKLSGLQSENTSQIQTLKAQIASLEAEKATAQSKLSGLQSENATQIQALRNQISDLESDKVAAQSKLSGLQQSTSSQSGELNDKIARLEASLEQKTLTISGLESQVLALKQQSVAIEVDKKQQEQIAQSTQDAISKKNAELNVLKAQLDERNAKLASLESRLKAAENMTLQIQEAKASEKSNDALIATLKEDLVGKSRELGESEAKIIQLQGQVAQLQSRMSTSQETGSATVVNLQSQIAKDQAKIVQLEAQIRSIQQQNSKALAQQASYVAPSVGAETQIVPTPASTKYAGPAFPSGSDYKNFLVTAGIPVVGSISEVAAGAKSENYKAYSWKTQSLYGSVEMRRVPNASAFNDIVSQYLERAKSRCQGEFAAVPSQTKAQNADISKSYEIACVGQGSSSSASVLFTYGKGIASTFAHEGRAEAMDLAIDARDRVAGNFR
ncbi:MAG: hypothetical protein RBR86_09225 [Pseudobdellovibrionaceae bacterium]|jgi:chromosome segregation ATPase|nr:hypothetical protein [Pseudobdellovibrionaceae bacterium]